MINFKNKLKWIIINAWIFLILAAFIGMRTGASAALRRHLGL